MGISDHIRWLTTQAATLKTLREVKKGSVQEMIDALPLNRMNAMMRQIQAEEADRMNVGGLAMETQAKTRAQAMTRLRVKRALEIVRLMFECLEVLGDGGVRFYPEQMFLMHEIWASCLPTLVGGIEIYNVVKAEIYRRYGIKYTGKGTSVTLNRRAGKSFGMCYAVAIMTAVAPSFRPAILNLYSPAGIVNLTYMTECFEILEADPKKRIRCRFIGRKNKYYLRVESHMQHVIREENYTLGADLRTNVPNDNEICSLPNMDAKGGNVRFSCFDFFFW